MDSALRHPRLWLAYFGLSTLFWVGNMVVTLAQSSGGMDLVQTAIIQVFSLLALVPLFGYVRQRRIAPRGLWRVVLVVTGLGVLSITVTLAWMGWALQSARPLAWLPVVAFFGAPLLWAIFRYIHRSPQLWEAATA